jgi:hypothetical protein
MTAILALRCDNKVFEVTGHVGISKSTQNDAPLCAVGPSIPTAYAFTIRTSFKVRSG